MPLMTVLIATSPASPPNPLFPGSLCCSWSPVTVPELCKPASASGHWHLSSRRSFSRACTWILPQVHRSLSDTHSPESFPWTLRIKELPLRPPTLQHHPLLYLSSEHLLQPGAWCRLCHGFGGPVPTTLKFLWELELVSCFIPKGWESVKHIVGAQQCFLN